MKTYLTIALINVSSLAAACGDESAEVAKDVQAILVPPADFPAADTAVVAEVGPGASTMTRTTGGVTAEARITGQNPGHVMVYGTFTFNYPEHCRAGENRLPVPGPCRGNGPMDPRDGAIPAVRFSADAWASTVVGADGVAVLAMDSSIDEPVEAINGGPGIENPVGAVIYVSILDKGAAITSGPLTAPQRDSFYGGCQGPPANGSLPCRMVAIVQHLP